MTTNIIELQNVSKQYGKVTALDQVSFTITGNQICGLLGRNGAGKTTLMHLLTAQLFASQGSIRIMGEEPYENKRVLSNMCFIKESQQYSKSMRISDVLDISSLIFPQWDRVYAERLIREFELPSSRHVKKLSRGMTSALGIVVGLASRSQVTIFDEPYLGLDAASRMMFYDLLIEDYSLHPRTIILSTHLIDEISKLLERVLVIDHGRLVIDRDADELRGMAFTVSGSRDKVAPFISSRRVLHQETFGTLQTATLLSTSGNEDRRKANELGLEIGPVSFQQLIVHLSASEQASMEKGDGTL
ncbi:MAG: ABC transporter ATP-binding protein [Gorillibacterium sp.]|nr:ABC transporter ATP-binding protein [Gorillibacterium sp.]